MKQIAIYGKGGIGKSTISANLSAALAVLGNRVLQVGCDPKHDSTRLITGGQKITTVLDYLKITSPDKCALGDIMFKGFQGVCCVEAGGPEPGVGCAGRGILTTFELLERLGTKDLGFDIVMYDVLGDVVCGGFAVPLRHEYADEVYIVSSGEFMSIYAANNILRGLKNYDVDKKRVGGIILNCRGGEDEEGRIERFSRAVNLPVCEVFPRSSEFSEAEKQGKTLVEGFKESPIAQQFLSFARLVMDNNCFFEAKPLTDEELEEIVLGKKTVCKMGSINLGKKVEKKQATNNPDKLPNEKTELRRYFSKDVLMREPLHGCAFNGAVNVAVQVQDAVTVAHGPKSCAHISYQTITSIGRRTILERGLVMPTQISPPLVSSEMNEGVMVFGGTEELKKKVDEVKEYKPSAVFVVTTCPAGIIGDNIDCLVESDYEGEIPVIPLKTDGNINGDYLQGIITAYIKTAKVMIKRDIMPEDDIVNIIAEKPIARNAEQNFAAVRQILNSLGLSINCRFVCKTSVKDIENFLRAKINILAYDDYLGRTMRDFLKEEYGVNFLERPFPVGFHETEEWISKLADCFHKQDRVEGIVERFRQVYREKLAKLKPVLEKKRLMVVTYNHDIDWIMETALDLKMEIVKVGILNYSQDYLFRTRFEGRFPVEENYDPENRCKDVELLKPDIVLSNYTSSDFDGGCCTDTIPLCPDVGFFSGIELAERWSSFFRLNLTGGWKKDEFLFQKYYA